ncbi:MAG: allophanate hydrolase, partial [Gemmatimonadetes bacterium]|nr:allophanate hydrolase [Gemmatimonadota bacterium]
MSGRAVVVRPGPLCTVQDLGRREGRRRGLSPGGAMDRGAFLWANRLLANPPDASALEVSLGGLQLAFDAATTIALTGAD